MEKAMKIKKEKSNANSCKTFPNALEPIIISYFPLLKKIKIIFCSTKFTNIWLSNNQRIFLSYLQKQFRFFSNNVIYFYYFIMNEIENYSNQNNQQSYNNNTTDKEEITIEEKKILLLGFLHCYSLTNEIIIDNVHSELICELLPYLSNHITIILKSTFNHLPKFNTNAIDKIIIDLEHKDNNEHLNIKDIIGYFKIYIPKTIREIKVMNDITKEQSYLLFSELFILGYKSLISIKIKNIYVTDKSMFNILSEFRNLKNLNIELTRVTLPFFNYLSSFSHLTELDLCGGYDIINVNWKEVLRPISRRITSLKLKAIYIESLSSCEFPNLESLSFASSLLITPTCPKLKNLSINSTIKYLPKILSHYPNVSKLTVIIHSKIEKNELNDFMTQLTNLSKLTHLEFDFLFDDLLINAINRNLQCKALKYFSCPRESSFDLKQLKSHNPELHHLYFGSNSQSIYVMNNLIPSYGLKAIKYEINNSVDNILEIKLSLEFTQDVKTFLESISCCKRLRTLSIATKRPNRLDNASLSIIQHLDSLQIIEIEIYIEKEEQLVKLLTIINSLPCLYKIKKIEFFIYLLDILSAKFFNKIKKEYFILYWNEGKKFIKLDGIEI